jgi:hypothetical protein
MHVPAISDGTTRALPTRHRFQPRRNGQDRSSMMAKVMLLFTAGLAIVQVRCSHYQTGTTPGWKHTESGLPLSSCRLCVSRSTTAISTEPPLHLCHEFPPIMLGAPHCFDGMTARMPGFTVAIKHHRAMPRLPWSIPPPHTSFPNYFSDIGMSPISPKKYRRVDFVT